MTTPHVNVLIATPGHSLLGAYVMSLLKTTDELARRGISWAWLNRYSSHVGDAREVTLANSRENNIADTRPAYGEVTYDKIIWIDSDIEWEPEDFVRLYESAFDIVSGAYMLENGEVTAYPQRLGQGYHVRDILQMSEPVKVHAVGFGFLAVANGIFEKLSRPWFQSVPVTMTDSETGQEWTFPIMGEDLSWCERVNNLGFEIWLDPLVRVAHHKVVPLGWKGMV